MRSEANDQETENRQMIPTAEFFRKYPWARFFSTDPSSLLGRVLLREQQIGGISMLPLGQVKEYVGTITRIARLFREATH